jgi:putative ABC transport system permease protein
MIPAMRMAIQALVANKLRAILTMLGTVIGVGCVVALWHIGDSGRHFMGDAISSVGENLIFIAPKYNAIESQRDRFRPLTFNELDAIGNCPNVKEVTPMLMNFYSLINGSRSCRTQVRACYPSYMNICKQSVHSGSEFTDADVRSNSRVVVLGSTVVRELFGTLDPIGQKIRIGRVPFTVLGTLNEKGSLFGEDQDNRVLIPYTTAGMLWGTNKGRVSFMFASAHDRASIPQAKQEIRDAVRHSQKIPPDRKDSVEVKDLGEIADKLDTTLIAVTMLLGAIGAISLLVGGIGIMNIMLVSVTERTKEIGLRIALGATDFNVLTQFLVEAMMLSGLGGLIGAGVGIGIAGGTTKVLSALMGQTWHLNISPPAIGGALIFALFIGVFFGFYPAWRASRLDPIAALRRE